MSGFQGRTIVYVWQAEYPWDVRVDKICRALTRHGAKVFILARRGRGQPEREEYQGATIVRVGSPESKRFSAPLPWNPIWAKALKSLVQETQPALVIAREIMLAKPAALAAHAAGVPAVIDMAEHYPAAMRSWKKYSENPVLRLAVHTLRIPDRVEREALRQVDGVLSVCEEQNLRLNREYGFPLERCLDVNNSPELAAYTTIPRGTSRAKPLNFGYHGVVIGDRDLQTVVRGFELAARENAEITLRIAGDGESLPEIRALRERSPHRERIHLTGRYRPDEIPSILESIDFGIAPWKVNEFTEVTVANKFYEYALVGKPFIYARTAPMSRLMNQFQCGIAYENANPESVRDAILGLLKADYASLSANGRKAVETQYHWGVDSTRMIEFLDKIGIKAD